MICRFLYIPMVGVQMYSCKILFIKCLFREQRPAAELASIEFLPAGSAVILNECSTKT